MRTCPDCAQAFASPQAYWSHFTHWLGPGTLCKGPDELDTWGFKKLEDGSWETWYNAPHAGESRVWDHLYKPRAMYEDLLPVQTKVKPKGFWRRLFRK